MAILIFQPAGVERETVWLSMWLAVVAWVVPAVPISNGGVTESYYWTQSLHDVTVGQGSCTHVVWQSGDSRLLAWWWVRCTWMCPRALAAVTWCATSQPRGSKWGSRAAGAWVGLHNRGLGSGAMRG